MALLGALNAALLWRIVRPWYGPVAALVASLTYAVFRPSIAAHRHLLIEPLVTVVLLVAVGRPPLGTGRRPPRPPPARGGPSPRWRSPARSPPSSPSPPSSWGWSWIATDGGAAGPLRRAGGRRRGAARPLPPGRSPIVLPPGGGGAGRSRACRRLGLPARPDLLVRRLRARPTARALAALILVVLVGLVAWGLSTRTFLGVVSATWVVLGTAFIVAAPQSYEHYGELVAPPVAVLAAGFITRPPMTGAVRLARTALVALMVVGGVSTILEPLPPPFLGRSQQLVGATKALRDTIPKGDCVVSDSAEVTLRPPGRSPTPSTGTSRPSTPSPRASSRGASPRCRPRRSKPSSARSRGAGGPAARVVSAEVRYPGWSPSMQAWFLEHFRRVHASDEIEIWARTPDVESGRGGGSGLAQHARAGDRGRRALRRRRGARRRRRPPLLPRSWPTRCGGRPRPSSPPAWRPATGSASGRPTWASGSSPRSASTPPAASLVPLNTRFKGEEAAYVLAGAAPGCCSRSPGFLGTDYVGHAARADRRRRPQPSSCCAGDAAERHDVVGRLPRRRRRRRRRRGRRAAAPRSGPTTSSDVIFTSGTTGPAQGRDDHPRPDAAGLRRRGASIVGLREGDRYLIVNPFFHTFGYKAGHRGLPHAGRHDRAPRRCSTSDAVLARVAERAHHDAARAADAVPVDPRPPRPGALDLSSLRLAVTGAAAVPVELVERMRDGARLRDGRHRLRAHRGHRHGHDVPPRRRPRDHRPHVGPGHPRRRGARSSTTTARRCRAATPGEILVRGYNVMQGYFDDPEQTAEAIDADGWLHTGDIGVMDERGYLQHHRPQEGHVHRRRLQRLPGRDRERCCSRHPDVAQVAVVGVPDDAPRRGRRRLRRAPRRARRVDPDELIAWARRRMANYKVPRRVGVVDALPLNAERQGAEVRAPGLGHEGRCSACRTCGSATSCRPEREGSG